MPVLMKIGARPQAYPPSPGRRYSAIVSVPGSYCRYKLPNSRSQRQKRARCDQQSIQEFTQPPRIMDTLSRPWHAVDVPIPTTEVLPPRKSACPIQTSNTAAMMEIAVDCKTK